MKSAVAPTFVLSLDTELVWGTLATHGPYFNRTAYLNTRNAVKKLLKLLESYSISATWAVVGHLMTGDGRTVDGEYVATENKPNATITGEKHDEGDPTLHARDLITLIRNASPQQEIGCHTFSHINCATCSPEELRSELKECITTALTMGITMRSYIFPYNAGGCYDIIQSHGFLTYRGMEISWYRHFPKFLQGSLHLLDQLLAITPPTYQPVRTTSELITIPGSMLYLSMEGIRGAIPVSQRVRKARKGINRAIQRKEIFHLWFHPSDLALKTNELLQGLDEILSYAAEKRNEGQLKILTMEQAAIRFSESIKEEQQC